ncbi:hypothetical protein KCU96_g45, partial [Aureobasidium melanogenum]
MICAVFLDRPQASVIKHWRKQPDRNIRLLPMTSETEPHARRVVRDVKVIGHDRNSNGNDTSKKRRDTGTESNATHDNRIFPLFRVQSNIILRQFQALHTCSLSLVTHYAMAAACIGVGSVNVRFVLLDVSPFISIRTPARSSPLPSPIADTHGIHPLVLRHTSDITFIRADSGTMQSMKAWIPKLRYGRNFLHFSSSTLSESTFSGSGPEAPPSASCAMHTSPSSFLVSSNSNRTSMSSSLTSLSSLLHLIPLDLTLSSSLITAMSSFVPSLRLASRSPSLVVSSMALAEKLSEVSMKLMTMHLTFSNSSLMFLMSSFLYSSEFGSAGFLGWMVSRWIWVMRLVRALASASDSISEWLVFGSGTGAFLLSESLTADMSTTGSPEVVSLTASSSTTYKASRREPELTSVLLDFFEVLAHRLGLLVVVKVFEFHVEHQALQALDLSEISGGVLQEVSCSYSSLTGKTHVNGQIEHCVTILFLEIRAKGVRKSLRSPRRQSAGELLLMRRSIWFGLSLSCACASIFRRGQAIQKPPDYDAHFNATRVAPRALIRSISLPWKSSLKLLIMPMLLMMVLSLGLLLPDNSLIQFLCFPNSV